MGQKQISLWSSHRWKTSLFARWLAEVEAGLDCLGKLITAFIGLITGHHKEIIRTGPAGNPMRYWGIAMDRALFLQRQNYSSLPEIILSGQNASRVSLKSYSHVRRSFRHCMRHKLPDGCNTEDRLVQLVSLLMVTWRQHFIDWFYVCNTTQMLREKSRKWHRNFVLRRFLQLVSQHFLAIKRCLLRQTT